jgi:uncharacterized membrane protein YheB (UPF0754 family)
MQDIFDGMADLLSYLSIPFVSALVGWFTNVLALKMTFYPIEYTGIRPFGWQGIIPSKARKMAETAVDLWTSRLIDLGAEFARIKPNRVAQEMAPAIGRLSMEIVDEVMEAKLPLAWAAAPDFLKRDIYRKVSEELPLMVEEMMDDVKRNFDEMLDLKFLAVSSLTQNKALLNQVFQKCGEAEFRFIERSGLYFGFLFGLIQMGVWYFYPEWWILPAFGLLVGYATNYLAIKLIFRPIRPIRFGSFALQGTFIKRQKEVATEYSHIVASRIITVENIFEYIIRGPGSSRLAEIVRRQIDRAIQHTASSTLPFLGVKADNKLFGYIRNIASYRFLQELPMNIRHVFGYAENALDLENILRKKMIGLSPEAFEDFLRPVFREDEFKLILIGGILGGIAGTVQYLLLFY